MATLDRRQYLECIDRLGRKQPVGHGDDTTTAGGEDPGNLREHLERAGQVLNRDRDENGVEACVVPRQCRVLVQVPDAGFVQSRVGIQFPLVHTVARHMPVADLVWQVRDPRRHQVEDTVRRLQDLTVILCQRGDGDVVDMGRESRFDVKVRVR